MERIALDTLAAGGCLGKPLFDRTGVLLLEGDQTITDSMLAGLRESGMLHAYAGAWNAEQVARLESSDTNYRALAGRMLDRLDAKISDEIKQPSVQARSSVVSMSAQVDLRPKLQRLGTQIRAWERQRQEAVGTTAQMLSGAMRDAEIPGAAGGVVRQMLEQFKLDPFLMLQLMNCREEEGGLYEHACNSALLAMSIAAALTFSEEQITEIGVGALLKDIGMRVVPDELIGAKRRLGAAEFIDIQKHTISGLNIIQNIRGLSPAVRHVVYQHHERVDGKGYPKGRMKDQIHIYARIVAVADAYESLISPRPWRAPHHPYRAMETLLRQSERAYDSAVIRGLLYYLSLFPVGSRMLLDTGEMVRVIATNGTTYDRPVVFVLKSVADGEWGQHQIVDLLPHPHVRFARPYEEATPLAQPEPRYCPSLMAV